MVHSSAPPSAARFPVHLTLLVPELIWPEPGDKLTLGKLTAPGLEWLAGRGHFERRPRRAFETALAEIFGLDHPPFGSLRLRGETSGMAPEDGHWLCADPVHLRFHHERIVLADAGAFDLEIDEAEAIAESLNGEFADIGRFHVADARRWYLRLNTAVDHVSEPISAIAGRRVDSELPAGDSTLTRWLNEVQMFLHGHPVNERRQTQGKPAINSLWLWGAGPLPAVSNCNFATVWSDNPLARGLAGFSNIPAHAVPDSLAGLLAGNPQGEHLVVLDSLLPPVLYENGEVWRRTCQMLDEQWFAPIRPALGGKIKQLRLVAPTIYGELRWTLGGAERWKFWRRPRPIAPLAETLAEGEAA